MTIASFNANENEISMAFPSLTVTADVSYQFHNLFFKKIYKRRKPKKTILPLLIDWFTG